MKKKCSECQFCKTYAEKQGVNEKLYTMVCTKDFPNNTVVDLYTNKIDEKEWKALECCK